MMTGKWITTALFRALVTLSVAGALMVGCDQSQSAGSPERASEHVAKALGQPLGVERASAWVFALDGMDSAARANAIAEVLERDLQAPESYELKLFAGQWARSDPEAAFERVMSWDRPLPRAAAGSEILEVWARSQPLAARQAYEAWSPSMEEEKGNFAAGLALGWVDSGLEPDGLAPFLSELKDWDREKATRTLLDRLIEQEGLEAAMQWADRIPDGLEHGYRHLVFRKIALTAGPTQPEVVAAWLEKSRDVRWGQSGFRVLGRAWAKQDPEAAMAWTTNQENDRALFLFAKAAFGQWYRDNPEAAWGWLQAAPEDQYVDGSYLMVALYEKPTRPRMAAEAALKIRDGAMRADTLNKVLGDWAAVNPEQAQTWLDSESVPEAVRSELKAFRQQRAAGHKAQMAKPARQGAQ